MDIGPKLFLSTTIAGLDSRDGVCNADLALSTQGRRGTYSCSNNRKLSLAEQRTIKLKLYLTYYRSLLNPITYGAPKEEYSSVIASLRRESSR